MLYECNYFRLMSLKYSPLLFAAAISLGVVPSIVREQGGAWPDSLISIVILLLISVLFILLFFLIKDKLRYVAIGKSKLIVRKNRKEFEYNWLDVEYIRLNRFLALYKVKMKSEESFYFTSYGMVTWLMGDNSDMGAIIERMKRELSL